jgi:hypothetical protein
MNGIDARIRAWLTWALPFVVIALLVGWETDWGHALKRVPAVDGKVAAQPVPVALLPEYRIEGGVDSRRETIERTLFNPTRRPAPPQASSAAKSAVQTGQFVLTGTTVVDKKATAFLREVNGGRSRRVQQGETINGLLVAEVRADRVRLTAGDAVEELTLKVAAGPKTTIQPALPAATPPQPGAPNAPQAQPTATPNQPGQAPDVAETLANRRRAARAAEAAAQQQQNAQTAAQPQPAAPAQQTQPAADPAWNDVYQRYIQRQK